MDLKLSDEQRFLVEAACQALGAEDTLEAARAGLDGGGPASLWGTAIDAGWCGLLSAEAVDGAELGALEAILVARECGAVLADTRLVGHLPAVALVEWGGQDPGLRWDLATGARRAVLVEAGEAGLAIGPGGEAETAGFVSSATLAPRLSGRLTNVLDLGGADLLVVCGTRPEAGAVLISAAAAGVAIEQRPSYDATRPLADVRFDDAIAEPLAVTPGQVEMALALRQALFGAEALGAADACLAMALEYAKSRIAFGRAIGSYQAIKHTLVEMLRRTENARALAYYAGWAWRARPQAFTETALALRVVADQALYAGARENVFVHGAVGATWEHDASLYYRRAELSRRLLGGADRAARRLADELLAAGA